MDHVPRHAADLAKGRVLELATTHVPVIVQVVAAAAVVIAMDVLVTADLDATIVAVEHVPVAERLAQAAVELVAADSVEIVVSSVIVNGGFICVMYT